MPRKPAAPKTSSVTIEQIEAKIKAEKYTRLKDTTVTICGLVLQNGYVALGSSACVDPANFNATLGREIARRDAIEQVWKLEGYLLAEKLSTKRAR